MHMVVMPPGASAKPHYHESHETAIYMLEGAAEFLHGPDLEFKDRVASGDYIYIPASVPHQPYNPTDRPARALIARTDPNEQESVVLIDDMKLATEFLRQIVKACAPTSFAACDHVGLIKCCNLVGQDQPCHCAFGFQLDCNQ